MEEEEEFQTPSTAESDTLMSTAGKMVTAAETASRTLNFESAMNISAQLQAASAPSLALPVQMP